MGPPVRAAACSSSSSTSMSDRMVAAAAARCRQTAFLVCHPALLSRTPLTLMLDGCTMAATAPHMQDGLERLLRETRTRHQARAAAISSSANARPCALRALTRTAAAYGVEAHQATGAGVPRDPEEPGTAPPRSWRRPSAQAVVDH